MVSTSIIFQDMPTFSHIIQMSRRELSIDVAEHMSILKNKEIARILVIFQYILMFGCRLQFDRSRREFSIDMANNRSILKKKE